MIRVKRLSSFAVIFIRIILIPGFLKSLTTGEWLIRRFWQRISVKENIGIDKIKDRIRKLFNIGELSSNDLTYLSNARTISLLKKSLTIIDSTIKEINDNSPIDIVELGLRDAWNTLGEVIGATYKDELLDELFSRFCLGK